MRQALIILAQQGFQDLEYAGTRRGLEDAGYSITLASTARGTCTGKFGGKEEALLALHEVSVEDFEKVAFIGGPGALALADSEDARRIARDTVSSGKVLGAICIAPTILARAGVLKGKHATVWDSGGEQRALLEEEGAFYTGEEVTMDGKVVTANGPKAAEEFGKVLGAL
jgi:protease I